MSKKKLVIGIILYFLSTFAYAALAGGQTKTTVIQGGTYLGDHRLESEGVVYDLKPHGLLRRDPLAHKAVGTHVGVILDLPHKHLSVLIYKAHSNGEITYDVR